MWNKVIQSNMYWGLHAVGGSIILTRVPDEDLSTAYISIMLLYVVDMDRRDSVDTQQVNPPPGVG